MNNLRQKIIAIKEELKDVILAAHFYQKDEVFELADVVGDSLELAKKTKESSKNIVVFCGVEFMGQSVKILAPHKKVYMPKKACCAMARMVDENGFISSVEYMIKHGIALKDILPVAYINCSAYIKAQVGKMNGYICTSANADTIMQKAIDEGKKILFLPDRCLGQNIANKMNKTYCIIGDGQDPLQKDIICYDGFCAVHQVFEESDIDFFKDKYEDILVVSHLECDPKIVAKSDFVGSTSQMIAYINKLPTSQKIVVATEFNLVKRMRKENTYVLSSSKPSCTTMNETSLQDLYNILLAIKENKATLNEILLDEETIKYATLSLDKMLVAI